MNRDAELYLNDLSPWGATPDQVSAAYQAAARDEAAKGGEQA